MRFEIFLKVFKSRVFFSESGSAFQSVGPAYINVLAPNVALLTFGTRWLLFPSALSRNFKY